MGIDGNGTRAWQGPLRITSRDSISYTYSYLIVKCIYMVQSVSYFHRLLQTTKQWQCHEYPAMLSISGDEIFSHKEPYELMSMHLLSFHYRAIKNVVISS